MLVLPIIRDFVGYLVAISLILSVNVARFNFEDLSNEAVYALFAS